MKPEKISKKESDNISALIGHPEKGVTYKLTLLPPVVNLLKHFEYNVPKVASCMVDIYRAGWLPPSMTMTQFKANIRHTKNYLLEREEKYGSAKPADDKKIPVAKTRDTEPDSYQDAEDECEIEYLRKQLKNARSEIQRYQTDEYMGRRIVNELRAELAACPVDRFKINVTKHSSATNNGYHNILPISDVHFGEVVNAEGINGLNSYDIAISKARHIALFKRNYEYASMFGCNTLHLFFLGDIFSGNIHDELKETNESPIMRCVVDYYTFITGLILEYANLYERIDISCVVGNHARNTQKYQFKNKAFDNYEYIMYEFMKSTLEKEAKNITVDVSRSVVMFPKVGRQTWKIEHGDRYKGGSAFVSPWSTSIRDNVKDLEMFAGAGDKFGAVIMGHWHTGGEMYLPGSNVPVYMNPSIIGPGEYSVNQIHSAYPASSFAFITDGTKVISKTNIDLMDIQGA